jgi:hypothetical protein
MHQHISVQISVTDQIGVNRWESNNQRGHFDTESKERIVQVPKPVEII